MNSTSRSCLMGCLGGCLLPILIFLGMGFTAVALVNSEWMKRIEDFVAAAPQTFGTEQINYLLSSPDTVTATAITAFFILAFLAIFLLPAAAALRTAASVSGNTVVSLKRTEAGEILTAQVSGLKNFIRDFSNLAQAEKEQLLLWDDFLIYAVVLEENERIVEDIFRMKNLKYRDYMLFEK